MTQTRNYEPAPLDFLKDKLTEGFRALRAEQTQGTMVRMNETDLERILETAMEETTEKYPDHLLPKISIPIEEFKRA